MCKLKLLSSFSYLLWFHEAAIAGLSQEAEGLNVWEETKGSRGVWGPPHMDHPATDVVAAHQVDGGVESTRGGKPADAISKQDKACVWCVHVCGVCMCVVCACVCMNINNRHLPFFTHSNTS